MKAQVLNNSIKARNSMTILVTLQKRISEIVLTYGCGKMWSRRYLAASISDDTEATGAKTAPAANAGKIIKRNRPVGGPPFWFPSQNCITIIK